MARNEKTRKKSATASSYVMSEADQLIGEFKHFQRVLHTAIQVLDSAKTSAASALTQAPDRKKRK